MATADELVGFQPEGFNRNSASSDNAWQGRGLPGKANGFAI
jgi:hypothetical protein